MNWFTISHLSNRNWCLNKFSKQFQSRRNKQFINTRCDFWFWTETCQFLNSLAGTPPCLTMHVACKLSIENIQLTMLLSIVSLDLNEQKQQQHIENHSGNVNDFKYELKQKQLTMVQWRVYEGQWVCSPFGGWTASNFNTRAF